MIMLSVKGYSVPQISEIHQVSDVMIYKWFNRFDDEGPAGLFDRPRGGRPRKVNEETQQVIDQVMSDPPSEQGYNFTYWTIPLLKRHLETCLALNVCAERVRVALHELGFRWRRPRWWAPQDDPDTQAIMAAIARAVFTASDETVVLLEDETIFKRLPPLRCMWMRIGQQVRIPTPPQNDDFCLYGALNLHTGQCTHASFDKANSESTLAFLEHLAVDYPDRPILLIWDQANFHTSQKVRVWLADHPRFSVYRLPKRSPQLNPVEALWRLLKQRVAANLNRTLEAIQAACDQFFAQHSPTELLACAGLL
jgi:transposase